MSPSTFFPLMAHAHHCVTTTVPSTWNAGLKTVGHQHNHDAPYRLTHTVVMPRSTAQFIVPGGLLPSCREEAEHNDAAAE